MNIINFNKRANPKFLLTVDDLVKLGFGLEDAFALAASMAEQRSILVPSKNGLTNQVLSHAIRAVEGKPLTYRAYGVLFGSPEETDFYDTYFTRDTKFYLDWFNERPWLYSHGMHPELRSKGLQRIGTWKEAGIDELGVFLQGELDSRHEYLEAFTLLANNNLMFPSSGTLDYAVDMDWRTGFISEWPIVEVSSTTSPAEWRMNAMTEDVRAAVRMFSTQGGNKMPGILDTIRERIAALKIKKDDIDVQLDADGNPIVLDEEGNPIVVADPVEDGGGLEVLEVEVREALSEVVEHLEQQNTDTAVIREAIQLVDGVLREYSARIITLEEQIVALGASRNVQLQNMVTNGSWYDGLFAASRDSDDGVNADELPAGHGDDPNNLQGGGIFGALQNTG